MGHRNPARKVLNFGYCLCLSKQKMNGLLSPRSLGALSRGISGWVLEGGRNNPEMVDLNFLWRVIVVNSVLTRLSIEIWDYTVYD